MYVFANGIKYFAKRSLVLLLQGEPIPFKPYTHRYYVPYNASGSAAPFWYSIKRASAYVIVLGSYSAYGKGIKYRCVCVCVGTRVCVFRFLYRIHTISESCTMFSFNRMVLLLNVT